MGELSKDAIIFGLAYLHGSGRKLSFGGEGAQLKITERARAALNELISAGYAETANADDQIKGREHYQGVNKSPHLGLLAKETGIDPFGDEMRWDTFVKRSDL